MISFDFDELLLSKFALIFMTAKNAVLIYKSGKKSGKNMLDS